MTHLMLPYNFINSRISVISTEIDIRILFFLIKFYPDIRILSPFITTSTPLTFNLYIV